MARPGKLVIIGLDSATLGYFKKFGAAGVLPNIKQLMDRGVATESYSAYPPATAVNWNTIVTGAYAATHGVTAMVRIGIASEPGDVEEPGNFRKVRSGFFATNRKAETLWEAGERYGKRPILLKYTGSWPPTVKQGIQVEGFGDPAWSATALAPRLCFATYELNQMTASTTGPAEGALPQFGRVRLRPARGWQSVADGTALEAPLRFLPPGGEEKELFALLTSKDGRGYDRVLLSDGKEPGGALAELKVGEWSPWLHLRLVGRNGPEEGICRCKLLELSPDGKRFKLFFSQTFGVKGWTVPDELAGELIAKVGPYQELTNVYGPYFAGWTDPQTYLEETEYQANWLGKAAQHLMTTYDWDLFFTQYHAIDHSDHLFLGGLDPKSPFFAPEREELCRQMIERTYQLCDRFVGMVAEAAGDDALVIITSDHGHAPVRNPGCDINEVLEQHGLLHFAPSPAHILYPLMPPEVRRIDWSRTQVAECQESYTYVNLKGRNPEGTVEPADFVKVRDRAINILRDLKHAETGDPIFALVLPKEQAGFLGLYGDQVGDIISVVNPDLSQPQSRIPVKRPLGGYAYTGNHHGYIHTFKFEQEEWTNRAVTVFAGPGVKKGVLREQPINLVDIAPTAAYLLGMPAPAQSEGKILHDIFE